MIGFFNRFLNTWAARAFFLVLLIALVGWGVGDMLRNLSAVGGNAIATVAGQDIDDAEFDTAYRRQLAQMQHMMKGVDPTPELKLGVAEQALNRLVLEASISAEVKRLHLAVPDEAVRLATFDLPAFKDPNGAFDHDRFLQVIHSNDMSEARFIALMRADLGQQELIEAARAGVAAPDMMVDAIFRQEGETRVAQLVTLPFAGAPEPAAPAEADLRRYYDLHADAYTSPEYRRIKAVILSPQTLARGMDVSDQDLHAAYTQRQAAFMQPEKRSLQVILATDEASARALADRWRRGADWTAMQAAAKPVNASTAVLDNATPAEIPSPDLAKAAFAAAPDSVVGPIHGPIGWQVLRVAAITPAKTQSFDQVKEQLRDQLAQAKAEDVIDGRAAKVQDALASGASLDELPGDLGLAAITGTLDAKGMTPEGTPAPIPAAGALRSAMLNAAFAAHKGDQPNWQEVPGPSGGTPSYFALTVEDVVPPAKKGFDQVAAEVRDDWLRDARRREQEEAATRLLMAVKNGKTLQDAAAETHLPLTASQPVAREGATPGVPKELVRPLFGLKRNEPTMVQTGDAFVVAQLMTIRQPDQKTDPVGFARARDQVTMSLGNDVEMTYAAALQSRAKPRVNMQKLAKTVQNGT